MLHLHYKCFLKQIDRQLSCRRLATEVTPCDEKGKVNARITMMNHSANRDCLHLEIVERNMMIAQP
jgi:hypothetical protein